MEKCEGCGVEFEPGIDYFTRQRETMCNECLSDEAEAAHARAEIERCGGPAAFPELFERDPHDGMWRRKQ